MAPSKKVSASVVRELNFTQMKQAERYFWPKVNKSKVCWVWVGCLDKYGYGKITVKHKTMTAHRFSKMLELGRVLKASEYVLHKCDVPGCVNPAHLFVGTHKMNMDDMCVKGRRKGTQSSIGSLVGTSKLTEEEVLEIRKSYKPRTVKTRIALAIRFNVTESTIQSVLYNVTWRHVE